MPQITPNMSVAVLVSSFKNWFIWIEFLLSLLSTVMSKVVGKTALYTNKTKFYILCENDEGWTWYCPLFVFSLVTGHYACFFPLFTLVNVNAQTDYLCFYGLWWPVTHLSEPYVGFYICSVFCIKMSKYSWVSRDTGTENCAEVFNVFNSLVFCSVSVVLIRTTASEVCDKWTKL